MGSICYTWNNSPFSWDNARLAWSDFCVIQTLLTSRRKAFGKKRKWYDNSYTEDNIKEEEEEYISEKENDDEVKNKKIEDLTEIEKKALINLIISMENKDSKILEEMTKKKNSDIIIDIKDIEISKTKTNEITIKINFHEI